MIKYIKKYKYIISIIILFFIIIMCFCLKSNLKKNNINKINTIKEDVLTIKEEPVINKIKVDIKGAVLNPGVYELEDGSRVIDLINVAGGLLEYSDTSLINLAKKLADEMVVIIYTKDEVANSKESNTVYKIIEKECDCPKIENDGCLANNSSSELFNINTCTIDDLLSLDGIGKSKAETIIKYREEHGNFSNIEDILNVSGIGDSLFEKIKIYITV